MTEKNISKFDNCMNDMQKQIDRHNEILKNTGGETYSYHCGVITGIKLAQKIFAMQYNNSKEGES